MKSSFDIPEVLEVRQGCPLVLELGISERLNVFAGHFDGAPLVPGVVQIGWVLHFAECYLGHDGSTVTGMHKLKFQDFILPGVRVRLEIERVGNELRFVYQAGGVICSSGSLELGTLAPSATASSFRISTMAPGSRRSSTVSCVSPFLS